MFVIGLSLTLGDFPKRFLKCSFHMCIRSSWLAVFSLVLEMHFLLRTSFTVCHAIRDSLSSTEFLILLIWHSRHSVCSFWHVFDIPFRSSLVSERWHYLGYFYYIGMLFSRCLVFTECLLWNCVWLSLWYAFCFCFHMDIDKVLAFLIRYLLKRNKFVSFYYCIFIIDISSPVKVCSFGCLRCIPAESQTYLCCDNSVIGRYSFKRGICLTIESAIDLFLIHEDVICLCFNIVYIGVGT